MIRWKNVEMDLLENLEYHCHADSEYFLQLQRLKSKLQVVSNIGLRVPCYNYGELFRLHATGHFSLAKTLPVSAHILSL